MQVAQKLDLPAVNFWYWEGCRRDLPNFWDLVREYPFQTSSDVASLPSQYLSALNSKNPEQVLNFYDPNAVHIRAGNVIQGKQAIREWITTLINQHAQGHFSLLYETQDKTIHNFRWQVEDPSGSQHEGRDTIGLYGNKISYHYSFIRSI